MSKIEPAKRKLALRDWDSLSAQEQATLARENEMGPSSSDEEAPFEGSTPMPGEFAKMNRRTP